MTDFLSPLDPEHRPLARRDDSNPRTHHPILGFPYLTKPNVYTWRQDYRSAHDMMRAFSDFDNSETYHNDYTPGEISGFLYARDLMLKGWPEGASRLLRQHKLLLSYTTQLVEAPKAVTDVYGDFYDIGSFMAGQPDHWLRFERETKRGFSKKGPIRLVIQHAVSTGASTDRLIQRGALALTLATLFERAGRPTEIVSADAGRWHFEGNQQNLYWTVLVKPMSRPLNVSSMAFAIAHECMERTFYLSTGRSLAATISESFGERAKDGTLITFTNGCGMPLNAPVGSPTDTITLDYLPDHVSLGKPEATTNYLIRSLEAQGVEISRRKQ